MFEYSNGRFVHPQRIVRANIYNKDLGPNPENGQPMSEIRVAIDLDTQDRENKSVYAGPFKDQQAAKEFIQSIPIVSYR